MSTLAIRLWEEHSSLILMALGVLNFFLMVYVVKHLSVLRLAKSGVGPKKNVAELQALIRAQGSDEVALLPILASYSKSDIAVVLHVLYRQTLDKEQRALLSKIYQTQGIESFDVANLTSKSKSLRLLSIKRLSLLGSATFLFDIKRLLDDKNAEIALYAFRAIAKKSTAINPAMLNEVIFRGDKKRTLLVSALKKIAESGSQKILIEALDGDLNDSLCIVLLKVLAKAHSPELLPLLMKAQGHPSENVRQSAEALLAKLNPVDTNKAGSNNG